MGKYYLGTGNQQINFQVVDSTGVINDLNLSGLYLSITGKAADADKLDNYDSSFFRNIGNLTGVYTGAISGKATDSELLDGFDSSYFLNGANITGTVSLSGTFTGYYTGAFSGTITHTDYIQFHTGLGINPDPAELTWDDNVGTMQLGLDANVDLRVGFQNYEFVANRNASTLSKGSVVYISGAQGNRPAVALALANADSTSAVTFGILAEDIPSMADGYAITNGLLTNLNTTGFAEGAALYLSPTVSGAIISSKPQAPNHSVLVGFCVRSHASAGEVLVKIQNGVELDELHDVKIISVQNNDIIRYNAPSGVWFNSNTLALNGTGSHYISGDLGIGTSAPTARLHIVGADKRQIISSTTDNAALVLGQWDGATNRIESSTRKLLITSYASGISLGVNGSENVHVSTSGNLGVGTTSPQFKLDVNGASVFRDTINVGPNIGTISWGSMGGGTGFGIRAESGRGFSLGSNGNWDYVVIDTSGNVGVGATTPTAKLNVHKAFTQSGLYEAKTFSITTDNGTSNWTLGQIVGYVAAGASNSASGFPGGLMFKTKAADSNAGESGVATRMVINAAGNVGINTTDPGAKFDVRGAGGTITQNTTTSSLMTSSVTAGSSGTLVGGNDAMTLVLSSENTAAQGVGGVLGFGAKYNTAINEIATVAAILGAKESSSSGVESGYLAFGTRKQGLFIAERMRITSDGNIGIGTTTPSSILDARLSSGATSGFRFKGYSDASTDYLLSLGTQTYPDVFQVKSVNGLVTMGVVGAVGATPHLVLQTNSTERIRILSGGNVGIGVTAPDAKLQVDGHVHIGNATAWDNPASWDRTILVDGTNHARIRLRATAYAPGNNNLNEVYLWVDNSVAAPYGGLYADYGLRIGSGNSSHIALLPAGNVGIGTASPADLLNIQGTNKNIRVTNTAAYNASGTAYLGFNGYYNSSNADSWFARIVSGKENTTDGDTRGYLSIQTNNPSSGIADRVRITSDGNVGIGTTTPLTILNLSGGGGAVYQTFTDTTNAYHHGYIGKNGGGLVFGFSSQNGSFSADEKMRVTTSGNVGIGFTTPLSKLHIAGTHADEGADRAAATVLTLDTRTDGTGTGKTYFKTGWINTGNYGVSTIGVGYWTGSNAIRDVLTLLGNGNVGIGTSTPATKLDVAGVGRFGSAAERVSIGHYLDAFSGNYSTIQTNSHGDFTFASNLVIRADHDLTTTNSHGTMQGAAIVLGGNSYTLGANTIAFFAQPDTTATAGTVVGTSAARMVIRNNGNVAIGATVPNEKLDVRGYIVSNANNLASEGGFYLGNNGHGIRRAATTNDVYVYTTSGSLYLGTSGTNTQHVTINSSGNVIATGNITSSTSTNATQTIQVTNSNAANSALSRLVVSNGTYEGSITVYGTGFTTNNAAHQNRMTIAAPFICHNVSGQHYWWIGTTGAGNDPTNANQVMMLTTGGQFITQPFNYSYSAWGLDGINTSFKGRTVTDSSTAVSGAVASAAMHSFGTSTLAATNTSVTTTNAATVYIAGGPSAGTNQTITNSWGLWNAGKTRLDGDVTIGGNLTVNGTTTTVNSTVTTIDDPIITLGGDTAPTVDDNKDRGVEFRWHNGTAAKVGFFGFDDSTGYFTFIPDATNSSEVFSGTQGDIQASNFRGTLIGNSSTTTKLNVTDSRNTADTPETISMGVVADFKANATNSLSDGGTYNGVLTFRQYGSGTDWSGGRSHQLAFTDNDNIWHRSGTSTSWGTWYKIWHQNNDGAGSGLDADLLDGYNQDTANTANTVVRRDASGNFSAGVITGTRLEARNSGTTQIYIDSTNNGSKEIVFQNNGATTGYVWQSGTYVGLGGGSASTSIFVTTSNGNVGVGTTTPSNKLDVNGSVRTNDWYYVESSGFGMYNNANAMWWASHASGSYSLSSNTTFSGIKLYSGGSVNTWRGHFYGDSSGQGFLNSSGNWQFIVNSSGNVGIGTTSPAAKLEVNGDFKNGLVYRYPHSQIAPALNSTGWIKLATIPNNSRAKFLMRNGSANSEETLEFDVYSTYFNSGVYVVISRNTYNHHLTEIQVQGADGQPRIVYVKCRTSDYAPTFIWQVESWNGASTIHNTEETPTSGKNFVIGTTGYLNANYVPNVYFDGNVGIGQIPATKLNVKEQNSGTEGFIVTNWNGVNTVLAGSDSSSGGGKFTLKTNAGANAVFISSTASSYFNGGKVGINTTSPDSFLQIKTTTAQTTIDDANQILTIENAAATDASGNLGGIRFRQINATNAANGFIGLSSTGSSSTRANLVFASPNTSGNATEKMRLTAYGTLLVGDNIDFTGSAWWNNGNAVLGKNGTDKVVIGYLASNTLGAMIGAHNSAMTAWAAMNINGTSISFRILEATKAVLDANGAFVQGGGTGRSTYGTTVVLNRAATFAANSDIGDGERFLSIVNDNSTTNAMATLGFRINPNGGNANAMLDMKFVNTGATSTSKLHYSFNHGGSWADRLTIQSDGNVGIGTTTPTNKLHVQGNAYINSTLFVNGETTLEDKLIVKTQSGSHNVAVIDYSGVAGGRIQVLVDGVVRSQIGSYSADNTFFNAGYGGNVGIGISTPSDKLDILGTTASNAGRIMFGDGGNYTPYMRFYKWTGTSTNYYQTTIANSITAAGALEFYTGGGGAAIGSDTQSLRMIILQGGNVGIGTTSPSVKLHVVGSSILANNTSIDPDAYANTTIAGNIADGGGWGVGAGIGGNSGTGKSWAIGVSGDLYFGYQNGSANDTMQTFMQVGTNRNLFFVPVSGNVGIGTTTPGYKLEVNGSFAATTKSFVIPHPTKEGKKLRYGSLEGPENGVYVRGKTISKVIELPDYWTKLVDPDSITVQLTPIGSHQKLYVEKIEDNKVYIANENLLAKSINCFFYILAERADVEKLQVEIDA